MMTRCPTCPRRHACRVPGDLARFDAIAHRLEEQHRNPLLQKRLHYFTDRSDCLVEAGFVDI